MIRNALVALTGALLATTLSSADEPSPGRARVLADRLFTVADDFVVDVYHNGEKVPDAKRTLLVEKFGATAERVDVSVREGDWLVFNVVNNRLRWGGCSYFGVTARGESGVAFTTERTTGRWSCCDDPAQVDRFIKDPGFLADREAKAVANPWPGGDPLMTAVADGWGGTPVWGASPNTWVKFVARPRAN